MENRISNWAEQVERLKKIEKDKNKFFGMYPSPPDLRDYSFKAVVTEKELPSRVDFRSYVPFILKQYWGVCVGKGIANAMNIFLNSRNELPEKGLSSMFIYTQSKKEDGIPNSEGTYPRVALKVAQKQGSCLSKTLPHTTNTTLPTITEKMKEEAKKYKIDSYAKLDSIYEIKQALANGKLVAVGTIVTDKNWDKPYITIPEGILLGLHLTFLCGYDDNLTWNGYKGFFYGINSWGQEWGDNGQYYMAYDYVNWETPDLPGFKAVDEAWLIDMGTLPIKEQPKETKIEMWVGKDYAYVNGDKIKLDQPPIITNNRTLVPIRFVSEQLGYTVDFDNNTKKITIY